MNLCWITLNVKNMQESLKFYNELLGIKIFRKFSPRPGVDIAMLGEEGNPKIELICSRNNNSEIQSRGISIGFEVKSLDESMEYMKSKGIVIKRGPISPSPKVKFFFIDDPDGIEIQIVENR
ncbi:VOC family protein [Clostridium luticellarii]|uniref:Lactoylglutathione lyase n=1 Tax=Clostridium luticellarii TaxID=1691940 RepID=A0A2T0BK21_9CLOT|nr:VOC family protein [Clostridium luticellarii]MCI1946261.1 VOC family protein [Clostridium luticellarii]MCI1969442.1 VOC family protein [Clostridium luticellarii]MCI1996606.1 VOC family protein [Clostridium luticellarii]MCI2039610.1 VOC family protein [Clostridium luticellarii]PRR84219.1 Lactoylglutathione lyase [Clostridium luticellarii]